MKIIDSDNYLASGVETMFFPGGEPHVKIPIFDEELLLHLKLRTWNDVGFAACLMDALEHQGSIFRSFIPYFPGARQDRTDGKAPQTAYLMADILDSAGGHITIFDPHSHVISDYLEDCSILMPADLPDYAPSSPIAGVIAPDEGATERAASWRRCFAPDADIVQCTKQRNPSNGRLSNYVMPKLETKGRYMIVDDICDGGGTFNLLAEAFFADSVGVKCQLEMFVSHGIFSRGLEAINPYIEHITTTDSWAWPDWEKRSGGRLTVIPLLPALIKELINA